MLRVCVCGLSCARLFAIPWAVACQVPLSIKFSRQEYWSRFPFPIPRDLPDPGIRPESPPLVRGLFSSVAPGNPLGLSGSIINIMFLLLVLMLIPFFSNYICSWLSYSTAVNSTGGFAYQDSEHNSSGGEIPKLCDSWWMARQQVPPWLLLSGHITSTRPTRSSWPSLCNQEGNPKMPGWWGKLLTVAATQSRISGWSLPPTHVSTGIWCPEGATVPATMTILEDPWLQPCCSVFLGHCSFSESNSPAFLSVLGAS